MNADLKARLRKIIDDIERSERKIIDQIERLERVVEFAAAHGPETCPKYWPEGCARAVVSMAQRHVPDPTYSLADEEGKAVQQHTRRKRP